MKKIINFCPTGTQPHNKSLAPLGASNIIDDVHRAYELGITLVHIHARDLATYENTYKKNVYKIIIEGIRKCCPDLAICVSLTGRLFPEFEKRSEVLELYPDMGSLTMSSLNFPGGPSINSPDMISKLINKMIEYGVVPEIECFDTGMINYTKYLIGHNHLPKPHYMNVILGNIFNAQNDLATVATIKASVPSNSLVCLGGIGTQQLKSNVLGLLEFDGVRIGLEDNLYFDNNKTMCSNYNLLYRIHAIMDELNLETMSPKEFQDLGFKNKIK